MLVFISEILLMISQIDNFDNHTSTIMQCSTSKGHSFINNSFFRMRGIEILHFER